MKSGFNLQNHGLPITSPCFVSNPTLLIHDSSPSSLPIRAVSIYHLVRPCHWLGEFETQRQGEMAWCRLEMTVHQPF